jgi:hypothetical protein
MLIGSLGRVLDNPESEKFRRVNPQNPAFARTVGATPGGVEFLMAVGYEALHGQLVLQSRDPALLWIGKAALEAVRASAAYLGAKEAIQVEQALGLSKQEYATEDAARRATYAKRVPAEPPEGAAGNALLCFHLVDGSTQVWRRFEAENTLEDVVNYSRSLPGTPMEGAASRPLRLSNVTMAPYKPLDVDTQLGLTLQSLDLWPTGHVKIEPE